jgi:trigger factor
MAHDHDHASDHSHPGFTVEVERTAPCVASVKFRVTADEFKRSREMGLKKAGRRTKLKGFRPGKAPLSMLEKMYGSEIDQELSQHFLQHAYDQAVRDGELRPAAQPRIDLAESGPQPGTDWEQEFEVLLRPDIELGEIEGIQVEGQPIAVEDQELEAANADLRNHLAHPEAAGEDGLPKDGMAVSRLEFFRQDGEEAILDREGIRLSPTAAPRGIEPEAFEEALLGAQDGESRELAIEFPEDFPVEEARGESGRCQITLTETFKVVPPTDKELFEKFEVEDDAGLQEAIRAKLREGKAEQEERRLENAILDKLLEAHPMDLPTPLVEEQTNGRMAEMRKMLEAQVTDPDELERRLGEEHMRAEASSRRALQAIYLMEEIARAKDLLIKEEDLLAEFTAIATRNGVDLAEVRKYYQEEGLLQQLALELLERKVRHFLRESADIKLA